MSGIAIITARGGSKRIPQKNIRNFCGKPIIAYPIDVAIKSGLFDEVMVSTDDMEIANVARAYGAKIPFMRSDKTSDDFATTEDVLEEVVENYKSKGKIFTWFACIYPTSPLIRIARLQEAYTIFRDSEAESLEAVIAFSYPPQRAYIIKDELLSYKWPEYVNARSQDLERFFHDAGQFYFFQTNAFMNMRRFNKHLSKIPFYLDEKEAQDIDNLSDWDMAEFKYRYWLEKGKL